MVVHKISAVGAFPRISVEMEMTRTTAPRLYRGKTTQGDIHIGGFSRARIRRILSAVSGHMIKDGDRVEVQVPGMTITLNALLIDGHDERSFIRLQQNCWIGNR